MGTGWLGWTPEITLNTPIPQIFIAFEAKVDQINRSNPFGGGATKKEVSSADKAKVAADRSTFLFMKREAADKQKLKEPHV